MLSIPVCGSARDLFPSVLRSSPNVQPPPRRYYRLWRHFPLGRELDPFWNNLANQNSGVGPLTSLPLEAIPCKYGGQATCFTGEISEFGPLDKNLQRAIKKNQKVMCREIEMGVAACQLALFHSGISNPELRNPDRFGIVFGSDYIITRPEEYADAIAACRNESQEFDMPRWPQTGRPQVNPLWLLKYLPNMPASHVAIYNDLRGPSNSVTIREASSGASIVEAVSAIRRGAADAMIAGATGSRMEPLRALNFMSTEPMASHRDNPAEMARPYDIDRDGNLVGEGAGALVLESLDHAVARGAKIWGEIVGGSSSAVGDVTGKNAQRDHIRTAIGNVMRVLLDQAAKAGVDLSTGKWHLHGCGKSDVQGDASEAAGSAMLSEISMFQSRRQKLLREPRCRLGCRRNHRKSPGPRAPATLPSSQYQNRRSSLPDPSRQKLRSGPAKPLPTWLTQPKARPAAFSYGGSSEFLCKAC